jgi:formylglycine-generating enzyme required for sulfatase activity
MKRETDQLQQNAPKPESQCRNSWRIITILAVVIAAASFQPWRISVKDRLLAGEAPTGGPILAPEHPSGPPAASATGSSTADPQHNSQWQAGQIWTNSLGMKLAYVPPGEFVTQREADMVPILHRAPVPKRVANGFLVGTTEVTQAQWHTLMGSSPWSGQEAAMSGDDYPASYVSWDDAVAFCKKLSEKERVKYRLPTQVEWEHACRAGAKTMFSFGGYDDRRKLDEYAWYNENSSKAGEKYAHRVSQKKPNLWGLYDTLGNVSEWCSDLARHGSLDKPDSKTHVFCGGSWIDDWVCCTPDSVLHDFKSDNGRSDVGFRICADVDGIAPPAAGDPSADADRSGPKSQMGAGLRRVGYSPDKCLICDARRTAAAKAAYSDTNGFGLCEDCGAKYRAWVRVLSKRSSGVAPDSDDVQTTEGFKSVMSEHFHRDDTDGRRGIGLFFLTGKFASQEWDTLTGGR